MAEGNVDSNFIQNVNALLNQTLFKSPEVYRKYGVTPYGQNFVFVVTSTLWYAVRFFIESDGREINPTNKNGSSAKMICKKEFVTKCNTDKFVDEQHEELITGEFDFTEVKELRDFLENEISIPADCLNNPDKYLKPGDHIRSGHIDILRYGHDGIYIGDGNVVHFDSDLHESLTSNPDARMSATVCTVSMKEFKANNVLHIVDHCIRRRHPAEIVAATKAVAKLWDFPTYYSSKAMSERYRKAPHRQAVFGYLCALGIPRIAPHLEALGFYNEKDI